jgi:hypothetical protein
MTTCLVPALRKAQAIRVDAANELPVMLDLVQLRYPYFLFCKSKSRSGNGIRYELATSEPIMERIGIETVDEER